MSVGSMKSKFITCSLLFAIALGIVAMSCSDVGTGSQQITPPEASVPDAETVATATNSPTEHLSPGDSVTPIATPDWASAVEQASTALTSSEAEDVPLYPGAEGVQKDSAGREYQPLITVFTVSATPEDVAAFYKAVLAKVGWQLVDDNLTHDEFILFKWPDPLAIDPHLLELRVYTQTTDAQAEPLAPLQTRVVLWPERFPYAARVPLYPGSTQVAVTEEIDEYGFINKITHYRAPTGLEELERYYKEVMLRHGWKYGYGDRELGNIQQELYFGREPGAVGGVRSATATISAEPTADGGIKVRIVAEGWDLGRKAAQP